jgi:hypothetical protein
MEREFPIKSIRIAVLVANAFGEPFDSIRNETYEKNWGRLREEGVDVFLLNGKKCSQLEASKGKLNERIRHSRFGVVQRFVNRHVSNVDISGVSASVDGQIIEVDIPDKLEYLLHKVIAGMKLLTEYDLVFKTTLSSVVRVKEFIEFGKNIDQIHPVVTGTLQELSKFTLVSGSNMLLNKKAIAQLVDRANFLDQGYLDDVAISKFFHGNIGKKLMPSMNLGEPNLVTTMSNEQLEKTIHFRCRSSQAVRNDIEIIEKLLKRIG